LIETDSRVGVSVAVGVVGKSGGGKAEEANGSWVGGGSKKLPPDGKQHSAFFILFQHKETGYVGDWLQTTSMGGGAACVSSASDWG